MPIYVVFLIVLLNMTAYRGSKVVVTLFAIELGAPQLYIGALVAMYAVFPMLLGLYAGKLTDRLGVRLPMIAGSLGVASGLLVPFIFPRLPALYLSATFIGASWVFYNVCVQNLVGILSDVESRAKNFSNYGLVMAGGSFFGPMLSGFSIDHFGHAQTYLHLALIPLVSALIVISFRSIPSGPAAAAHGEEHVGYSASLLKNVPLRRTLITSGIVLTGTDLFQFYMPIYGHSDRAVGFGHRHHPRALRRRRVRRAARHAGAGQAPRRRQGARVVALRRRRLVSALSDVRERGPARRGRFHTRARHGMQPAGEPHAHLRSRAARALGRSARPAPHDQQFHAHRGADDLRLARHGARRCAGFRGERCDPGGRRRSQQSLEESRDGTQLD